MSGRRRIPPLSSFEAEIGFTRALRVGNRILVSGMTAVLPDGAVPADAGAQADRCFAEILRYVAEPGGEPEHIVHVRMFVTGIADADAVSAALPARAGMSRRPARLSRWRRSIDRNGRWRSKRRRCSTIEHKMRQVPSS
jgi:enamine deaminase RidA (YjgF/YER057c/UK114 family)